MAYNEFLLQDITTVSATQMVRPLGSTVMYEDDTYGWQTWIYVKNGGTAAWAQGDIVARRDGQTSYDCDLSAVSQPSMRVAGVAQHAVAAGYYAWVLREGIGEVLADTGGITANTALVVGNAVAGRADDVTAVTDDSFAFSTEAALATATATCYVNCRG